MAVTAEFTVEPFVPGSPGPHVLAAVDAARAEGATVDMGPFGNTVTADGEGVVFAAIDAAMRAAVAHGATHVTVSLSANPA